MKREDFIRQLDETVVKRRGVYAPPERNFGRIAKLWSVYLDDRYGAGAPSKGAPIELAETDVAIMCGMIKIARLMEDPRHEDSWLDLAGYACCGSEVSGRAPRKVVTEKWQWREVKTPSGAEGPAAQFRRLLEGAAPHEAVEWPKGLSYQEIYDICADVRKAREFDAKFKAACQDVRTDDEKIEDAALDANEKVDTLDPRNFGIKIGGLYRHKHMADLCMVTGSSPDGPFVTVVPWPSRNPRLAFQYDKDDFLARFERVPPAEEAELLKDES